MNKVLIFIVSFVIVSLSVVQCEDSEFVTLWTPKFAQEDAKYQVFILPSNVDERTEIAVQFRKASAALILSDGKLSTIEYPSTQRNFGNKKSLDLTMTLYRNKSSSSGTQMHCSTRKIDILPSTGHFYNFIQTDKPIYKPGDEVQFRILTVDKDLKPFHRNTIDVNITDPFGRSIWNFHNQEGKFVGVFDGSFNLSTSTILGDWKITVIVDKKPQMAVSKVFAVQKHVLPLFDVYIDIPERHVLQQNEVTLSIYAKYSFGEYVTGDAELIIRRAQDGKEYLKEAFSGIQEPKVTKISLKNLGIATLDQVKLEAFVTFSEPESGIKFNKTAAFYAHYDKKHKLNVVHPEKYLPGFPFTVKVFVNDWKNEKVLKHFEKVDLAFLYTLRNGSAGRIYYLENIKDGVYVNEFKVPNDFTELSVEAKFIDSDIYRKDIQMGSVSVGINSLSVDHSPKNPKLYDKIKIFVNSDTVLDDILMAVITRYGNTKTKQIHCSGQQLCEFELEISEEMMPHSTVIVYDVKDKQHIYQGKTLIETENLGRNHLKLELPTKTAKTKQDIKMKFTTKARSKVYVLAFDKRLTYLREGNDITKSDIVQSVADYDGENRIIVDDLSSWKLCSPEELERVKKGRQYVSQHTGDVYRPDESDDDDTVWEDDIPVTPEVETEKDLLREYFPETWIFETLQIGTKPTFDKSFTTPDSITTWLVSAFSVHKDHGIALTPTQELIVMEEFFVKLNLPYSIRYKEVLRLDILVYNYVKSKEQLTVDLKVNNLNNGKEFQFVEYKKDSSFCEPSYNNNLQSSTTVTVPAMGVKKVHFYIRSNPSDNKFEANQLKKIKIQVDATGTDQNGETVRDLMQRKLIVEPVGIKTYKVISDTHKLNGETTRPHLSSANYTEDLTKINVVVTGDFLSDSMSFDEKFELNPSDCLEQKTSKFKRNADTYRYLIAKNKHPSNDYFTQQYQAIIATYGYGYYYKDYSWYRAHLVDAIATAMKSGALSVDKTALQKEFDELEKLQASNGTFSNFNFYFSLRGDGDIFKFTERYFATAYCLIPFLKHKDFLDKDYSHVIEKSFMYLNKRENRLQVMRYGLSIAAYAYALANKRREAEELLDKVEETFIDRGNNKKCYKIEAKDGDCDVTHTAYAALALLKLNLIARAEPLVYWFMDTNMNFNFLQETYYTAAITEPIAELGIALKSDVTNLRISLKNEHGFSKNLEVLKDNSHIPQDIEFPNYSQDVISTISGYGYCTVSMIFERIVIVPQIVAIFKVNIHTDVATTVPNEKIVRVCAKYDAQTGMDPVLVNVIYEIGMPSGYIYSGIVGLESQNDIKQVTQRRKSTLVILYYNDFEEDKEYCVDVKIQKVFEVKEAGPAGVKVYDFNNKENVAVSFYKFTSSEC